jgi:hypothetical protein
MTDFQLSFDAFDEVSQSDAETLIQEFKGGGVDAEIKEKRKPQGALTAQDIVSLITVATASSAALSVAVAFLYRVFQSGVILDLRASPPKVSKRTNLPKGTLVIIHGNGQEEVRQGIPDNKIGEMMSSVINLGLGKGEKPKQA